MSCDMPPLGKREISSRFLASEGPPQILAEIDGPQIPDRQGADPLPIREAMAYYRVPGLSIAVTHDFAID